MINGRYFGGVSSGALSFWLFFCREGDSFKNLYQSDNKKLPDPEWIRQFAIKEDFFKTFCYDAFISRCSRTYMAIP